MRKNPFSKGRAESFFTLIEIFIFVCNKLLLMNDDLSRRCGLCPKGWEWLQRCEPRAVGLEGVPWPTASRRL